MRKFNIFTTIFLMVFLTSNSFAINKITESEADKYINSLVKKNQFSGSVLIAHNKKIILKKGYGKAVYEFDVDNDSKTKFRIGSLTKQFTAMSILMLAEKNKLNVNDRISKFLPDYPGGNKIEIVHLLTHTSGIPDHTELPGFNKERRVYPHKLIHTINTFKNLPLQFSPGEKFKYSNSGYILLGYIIEKVSGISYQNFVKNHIFKPLKMDNSGFEELNKVIQLKANGYNFVDGKIVKAAYRNISNAHASGAIYSTIEDLYLWDRALYTDSLVSYDSLKEMFAPYTKHYGYGWGIVKLFGHKMVGHNGETEGFTSNISRFADNDLCI
ncbi:MAG: serine hydrolase, partial [Bacteroidota bacterium]